METKKKNQSRRSNAFNGVNYFMVNEEQIYCNNIGRAVFSHPIFITNELMKKKSKRFTKTPRGRMPPFTYNDADKSDFNSDMSRSYIWLCALFNSIMVPQDVIAGFASVFAHYIQVSIPRMFFRKKKTLLYWLEQNFSEIIDFVKHNKITVNLRNQTFQVVYPVSSPEQTANLDQMIQNYQNEVPLNSYSEVTLNENSYATLDLDETDAVIEPFCPLFS